MNIIIEQINFFDLFHYTENTNIFINILINFVLIIVTLLLIYIIYRKKERIIISLEKSEVEYEY